MVQYGLKSSQVVIGGAEAQKQEHLVLLWELGERFADMASFEWFVEGWLEMRMRE